MVKNVKLNTNTTIFPGKLIAFIIAFLNNHSSDVLWFPYKNKLVIRFHLVCFVWSIRYGINNKQAITHDPE